MILAVCMFTYKYICMYSVCNVVYVHNYTCRLHRLQQLMSQSTQQGRALTLHLPPPVTPPVRVVMTLTIILLVFHLQTVKLVINWSTHQVIDYVMPVDLNHAMSCTIVNRMSTIMLLVLHNALEVMSCCMHRWFTLDSSNNLCSVQYNVHAHL